MVSTRESYNTDCFARILYKATPIYTGYWVTKNWPDDLYPVDKSPKTVDKSMVLGKTRLFVRFWWFFPPPYLGGVDSASPDGILSCGITKLILFFSSHPQGVVWKMLGLTCPRYGWVIWAAPKYEEQYRSSAGYPHIHKPYEDYYRYNY